MQEKDKSILWIVRCITDLVFIRRYLDKPFVDCKKDHLKLYLRGWLSIVLIKEFKIKLEVN